MSELMTPIPFRQLMTWITTEYAGEGSVFGVHRPFHPSGKTLPIFGETIETPFGPAAGPNTQLAQNIVAGYFAGRLHQPPLHSGRGRVLQLRVVHGADRPSGL